MGHDFGTGNTTAATSGFATSTAEALTGAGSTTRLRMPPSPNFLYCHHPERWQIMDGEVLPVLHKLEQSPGVANVSPRNGGDMSGAIGVKVKNGWTIIPHDVIPGGYVRKFEGAFGPIHLTKWETPRQHGLRAYDPKVDITGYREFLRDLMNRGVLQPPMEHILETLVERAQAAVDRSAPHTATEAGKKIHEAEIANLHAIEVACGMRQPAPKPKAKRKRTRSTPKKPPEVLTDG